MKDKALHGVDKYIVSKMPVRVVICFATYLYPSKNSNMKLSQRYLDFDAEVNVSVAYLTANATRLKLDAGQIADIATFLTNWGALMLLYLAPATHASTIQDMKTLYHEFHVYMENLKKQIKANKFLALVQADYDNIHMHADADRRVHIPRPVDFPANLALDIRHLHTKIFTSNPKPGHENDTNMPVDVEKITRKVAVVAVGVTPIDANYQTLEPIGRTQYHLVFAHTQVGAVCWLITGYENARGEDGPPSIPYSFPII